MDKCTGIILKKNGDIKEIKIDSGTDVNCVLFEDIKHLVSKCDFDKMDKQCNWEFDEYDIALFGAKYGKAGQENKTELPIPEDTDLYFGDILVLRSKNNKLVDFKKKDWKEFYEVSYGGFETLSSSDNEENMDDSSDEDYLSDLDLNSNPSYNSSTENESTDDTLELTLTDEIEENLTELTDVTNELSDNDEISDED